MHRLASKVLENSERISEIKTAGKPNASINKALFLSDMTLSAGLFSTKKAKTINVSSHCKSKRPAEISGNPYHTLATAAQVLIHDNDKLTREIQEIILPLPYKASLLMVRPDFYIPENEYPAN
ncbi:MAG: hypothetical protein A2Y89_04215 [Chloroflexi bacterium RBG_13_51_18]|nr:MAG: hypothetical protein A2Y89_04215 [Chloroflexi bacterium RBG_13_51_18]